jgi:hypothetical protein
LLVAGAMNGAVMRAARRDSEFVTGLAAERSWLRISKMMWIRWLAAADEACLLSNVAQMLPVAIPARCSNRGREACDLRQKLIAQCCRLARIEHLSGVALRGAPQSSISGLSGRRRKSILPRVELTAGCWPAGNYVRDIKVILTRRCPRA